MRTKQERIEALAERIGSTAKTMAGLKKYCRTHRMPKNTANTYIWGRSRDTCEIYYTKKITRRRPALNVIADRADDISKIKTRHSKYSRLSITSTGGTVRYKGNFRGYNLHYANAYYRYTALPGGDQLCSVYTDRKKLAVEIIVPGKLIPKITKNTNPLLVNDIIAEKRHGIIVRYTARKIAKNKYTLAKSGVAVEFIDPENQEKNYWEHGLTIRECRAEYARKKTFAEQKNLQKIVDAKKRRAISLIIRLVKSPVVSYGDARRAGACRAGIMSFAQKNNVPLTGRQSLQVVIKAHQQSAYMVADRLAECIVH